MIYLLMTSSSVGMIIFALLTMRLQLQKRNQEKKYEQLVEIVENTKDLLYYYQIKPSRKFKYLSPFVDVLYGKGAAERAYSDPDSCFRAVHLDDRDILRRKITGGLDYEKPIIQRWRNADDGTYRWTEEYTTPIYSDGQLVAIQGVIRDIDEKMKLQQELEYRINHDFLTGLYNRAFLEEQVKELDDIQKGSAALIVCDLDELKSLNDRDGHEKGDDLIKATAAILDRFSSPDTIVSRIGGDEFVILVKDKDEGCVKRLISDMEAAIDFYNGEKAGVNIQLSIGYAHTINTIGRMDALFTQADREMYKAKKEKKDFPLTN
ncbi:diguanylate cyclase [Terribacillus saccharophilus]|uniref:GGDEF domain-containing protein n=1 Tax=Terribacillus saccharophilus TaxID=361277 RepID=UPI003982ADC1